MRLDKLLASSGYGTRSAIRDLIRRGTVSVNGNIIKDAGANVSPDDSISISGQIISGKSHLYFMLDKPDEVVTAVKDSHYKTVYDFLPPELLGKKISPVGRLDYHTTGLLLLTNDGDLSHKLTSPQHHVAKKYLVTYSGDELTSDQVKEAAEGMTLHDMDEPVPLKPAELILLPENKCFLILTEGKTHQVKRMIASWGRSVTELRRISIGGLELPEDSVPGTLTELTEEDIKRIFSV